ncbi:MAG: hypothetical protein JW837_17010 [Sedimentisphaerales bacterium]|nr:hypothetical protein [Sedimentisphaerales bacterium]
MLTIYCIVARIIGWILLTVPSIGLAWTFLGTTAFRHGPNRIMLLTLPASVMDIWMLGFIALGVSAFIRYVFETESHPGWTLRHSEVILYICAVLIVIAAILRCASLLFTVRTHAGIMDTSSLVLGLLMPTILCAAKVLILIGLGKLLRRLMPVIEESKSLV